MSRATGVDWENMTRKRVFDKTAWMVSRERFRLTDWEPPPEDTTVSIRDVLGGIFKNIEANDRPWLGHLEQEWDTLVGVLTSGHARPGGLRGQTLVVYVDSAVWLNELARYKRPEMLAKLQKRFGVDRIKSISLQPDPGSSV